MTKEKEIEEKIEEETEKETEEERFELIEVPTQMGLAFKDNSDESILDTNQLLLKIANEIESIKQNLFGK